MSYSQLNRRRRPTPLEEQAYAEGRSYFAEQLKQFPASKQAVEKLERNLATMALTMNMAAARSAPQNSAIQTDDGSWHKSTVLFDNVFACHRRIDAGVEYAVVEQFPNSRNEVWTKGRHAVEVLRTFTGEQKHALRIWTEDMTAQIKEFLVEKYPGQDMSQVADGFMHRFTHGERIYQQQSRSRGIRI